MAVVRQEQAVVAQEVDCLVRALEERRVVAGGRSDAEGRIYVEGRKAIAENAVIAELRGHD